MCGRFSLGASATALVVQFDLPNVPAWTPRYNIAPTQEVLAIVRRPDALDRQARLLRWGLIPMWAEGPAVGSRTINARAETVATKPAFRRAFKQRRCLVLADGFYEWQRQDGRKQPYYIRLHDARPFAFAGLWERWVPPDGQPLDSCTIITTVANDLIRPLHVRMPVVLSPAEYDVWLDPSVQEAERLRPLLRPYPPEEMETYPVSTRVNNPANDTPECIATLRGQGLKTN
jgi:putative SOS response-associated peptidase YedK